MDDTGTGLVVLLLGNPHLLECRQGCQDGATDPDRILPLRGSNDFDLDGGWSQGSDLLLHSVSDTGVHGGASGEDSIGIQVLPDVNIALHDGVVDSFVDAARFHTQEGWLEQSFWTTEPFIANGDHLTIRQLVGFFQRCGGGSGGHFLLEVKRDIAQLLLDVPDNLPLSSGGERVTSLCQDLHQIISEIPACQVQTQDSMGQCITLKLNMN